MVLRGFSIGGHIATIAAARLKQHSNIEVGLIAVDGFARFNLFAGDNKHKQEFAGKMIMQHVTEDAVEAFLSLDPKKCLCINRIRDQLMWETETHNNRGIVWGVLEAWQDDKRFPNGAPKERTTCVLDEKAGGHDHDVILLGTENPCLAHFKKLQDSYHGLHALMGPKNI